MKMRRKPRKKKRTTLLKLSVLFALSVSLAFALLSSGVLPVSLETLAPKDSETIRWVDFNVTKAAMKKAMGEDIATWGQKQHFSWIDALAYLAAKNGGDFSGYKPSDLDAYYDRLREGESLDTLTRGMKHFAYYKRAYGAVLSGFLGEFTVQVPAGEDGAAVWEKTYGLKAFSPIAEGYWYTHYDDFGAKRSYGYDRTHLGHDMMASTGTPIIAIEGGIVENMGWNQYGGWRIGIRSLDRQRYYYYAHMRKDHPYNDQLYPGKAVSAGDVIGYSGRTGYSIKENVNNIDTPHLHVGMQLIFNEEEKDSPNQIWIDMYAITSLLEEHRCPVYKNEVRKEYYRKYLFSEPSYFTSQVRT